MDNTRVPRPHSKIEEKTYKTEQQQRGSSNVAAGTYSALQTERFYLNE